MTELLTGFGVFLLYFIIGASSLLIFKFTLKPKDEVFRKLLHLVCVMSIFVLLYAIDKWYIAMMVSIFFAIIIYPIIAYLEKYPSFMSILIERKVGEIKNSLMIVFFMMATLIFVFWGILGEQWKYIILLSIMAWGYGDAAAALVGKSIGVNIIKHKWIDGNKTREGTIAMYIVSAMAIFICLVTYTSTPWYLSILVAMVIAPVCAIVELISKGGIDTITVPFATAIPTFIIMLIISKMGG